MYQHHIKSKLYLNAFQTWICLLLIKSCFLIHSFIFKMSPNRGNSLKDVFIPKLLNNPLASCSFIILDILLSYAAYLMKDLFCTLLLFLTFGFLVSLFFLHFKQYSFINRRKSLMNCLGLYIFDCFFYIVIFA